MTSKNKKTLIFAVIIILILVIMVIFAFFPKQKEKIEVKIHVESGLVKINENSIVEESGLKEGDIIETGEDGYARVILYNSIIIALNPNTVIRMDDIAKEHPKVSQERGTTWSTFLSILGVNDYTIKAGNSVASVRGTFFGYNKNKIIVGSGIVNFSIDGKEFVVNELEVVEKINGKIVKRGVNRDELEIVKINMERTLKELEGSENVLGLKLELSEKIDEIKVDIKEYDLKKSETEKPIEIKNETVNNNEVENKSEQNQPNEGNETSQNTTVGGVGYPQEQNRTENKTETAKVNPNY